VPAGQVRVPQVIRGVLSRVRDDRAAIFVDVPLATSLPSTGELRKAGYWVVPIIQRWAAERAVLPCERLVADLMAYAPPTPWPADSRGVVFLLDGGRAGPRQVWGQTLTTHEEPTRGRFDNRYSYPACRFPPPIFLQAMGVTRVDWISTSGIAPDLAWYAESLAEAGLRPVVS
jgi:hypothetical protein